MNINSRNFTIYSIVFVAMLLLFHTVKAHAQYPFSRDKDGNLVSDNENPAEYFKGKKPLQVFIETSIFEVLISNEDNIGFVYDLIGEIGDIRGTDLAGNDKIESDLGVLGVGRREDLLPAGANVVARVYEGDDGEIRAVIQALAEDQIVKLHSNPILLTLAGVPAQLETGEDIPFLERTNLGDVETVASKYRQTGVTLNVTPYVGYMETDVERQNPYIRVEIDADLSTVSRFREENGFTQPIIDTRKYQTNVWLKSGNRIIIGSLFRDSLNNSSRGVPILRDIPLLGRLFHNSQTDSQVSQLYIIIRPVLLDIWSEDSIVSQEQEFRRDYQQLQKRLDEQTEDAKLEADPFNEFRELLIDRSSPN